MRIKKYIAIAIIAAGIVGGSGAALAQATANTSASGSATIIRPITISKTADLQFGRVVLPSSGSATVTIANTADSISTGTAVALSGITTSRGKFTISGESAQAINITVGTLSMSGPSASTLAVTLSPDQVSGAALSGATIGSAGSLTLNVGGSFALPSTQTTGVYTGTFTVNVGYQ
jgi:hypothetical protein